jgi:hypothetical protein
VYIDDYAQNAYRAYIEGWELYPIKVLALTLISAGAEAYNGAGYLNFDRLHNSIGVFTSVNYQWKELRQSGYWVK